MLYGVGQNKIVSMTCRFGYGSYNVFLWDFYLVNNLPSENLSSTDCML